MGLCDGQQTCVGLLLRSLVASKASFPVGQVAVDAGARLLKDDRLRFAALDCVVADISARNGFNIIHQHNAWDGRNMAYLEDQQRLVRFFKACIECSIYIAPTDPGLTYQELLEAGSRAGYQQGEMNDALMQIGTPQRGNDRILPSRSDVVMWLSFLHSEDPDFRSFGAFDFVFEEVGKSVRANGAGNAKLERNVVVERGVANNLSRTDVHAAIAVMILTEQAKENDGILSFGRGAGNLTTSRMQLAQHPTRRSPRSESRILAHSLVTDIIERRSDGRPQSAEPFDAFAETLEKLGYGMFRMWWTQMLGELRQAGSQTSSVTITVLSAALVEGALTFVVKHARALGLGPMGSNTFEGPATKWRLEDLVESAGRGKDDAILDNATQQRANTLIRARQRIHAGRMLSEFPEGPPDLRPEEARDALSTAEQVVRRIVDWLQQHPFKPEDHA